MDRRATAAVGEGAACRCRPFSSSLMTAGLETAWWGPRPCRSAHARPAARGPRLRRAVARHPRLACRSHRLRRVRLFSFRLRAIGSQAAALAADLHAGRSARRAAARAGCRGIREAILVGHSDGGSIAAVYAGRRATAAARRSSHRRAFLRGRAKHRRHPANPRRVRTRRTARAAGALSPQRGRGVPRLERLLAASRSFAASTSPPGGRHHACRSSPCKAPTTLWHRRRNWTYCARHARAPLETDADRRCPPRAASGSKAGDTGGDRALRREHRGARVGLAGKIHSIHLREGMGEGSLVRAASTPHAPPPPGRGEQRL